MISRLCVLATVALAAGCTSAPEERDSGPAQIPAEIEQDLAEGKVTRAIVRFDPVRGELFARVMPAGVRSHRTFRHLPAVVVELDDLEGAHALSRAPGVLSIEPDLAWQTTLTESLAQISQPEAAAAGYLGTGVAVAVFDTGADYAHPDLGSCTAVGVPDTCRVVHVADFAADDASLDDDGHGTNVSSIVAAVAPGADIIALDVFEPDGYAYSSVLMSAIDWVIDQQATYNIGAVNMSLGGGSFSSACYDSFGFSVDLARALGISVVVSSGNNATSSAIGWPACIDSTVSVGAVYDQSFGAIGWGVCSDATTAADQVTCFSNASSQLDILAPGALIDAGGWWMGGTSQAAPHVAGAVAVLRAANPEATTDEIEALLITSDTLITDPRNGLQFPRLDLLAALDSSPPQGTVSINGGAAAVNTGAVTLSLAASGAAEVCLSNTATCTAWQAYASQLPWTLAVGTGTKTVYATFRSASQLAGDRVSDSILVDTVRPLGGALTVAGSTGQLALSWSGFTDASSGVASYRVMQATGTVAPANCTTGTPVWSGSATSTTLAGLIDGTSYALRVCAVDAAGNVSAGVTATATPRAEYNAPTGTISLNSGAAWTTSTSVTATLSATDDTSVSEACLSNTTACTAWFPMTSSKTWTLTVAAGTKTVYANFRDPAGNVSARVSDTIGLDTVKPTNGVVTATGSTGQIALSWTASTDVTSGIASYRVMQATGTVAPASCTTGTPVWSGSATSTTLAGLIDGTSYALRVCAVDAAGNVSAGVTATATPRAEYNAPTGTISLNTNAAWTTSTSVTATLSATDDTSVSEACLSNTTTCTAWFPMTSSKTWTLTVAAGTKTVYANFRDPAGNVSARVSDTIGLDTVKPVNGTVSATPAAGGASVSWSGFTDATSGIASYTLMYRTGSAPTSCSIGTLGYSGATPSTSLSGLLSGTTYYLRVCAVDTAGNVSIGATSSFVAL